ncbi:MAG: family 2 glycosyl transferase [Isosphaera sp.]|nr:family 2 glycosyl transferase [Isosphaera sp.]
MTPTVSVVMAAKNYARFLPEAVGSVLAQSFADWELLVVDDGSADATPAAVRPFLADPRVRYVRSDRLGQARAKNLGVRLGRGRVVAFLDADDAWEPTKLAKQLALLDADPAVGVVFCRRTLMDEAGNPLPPPTVPPPPRGRVLDAMFVQNFVCFSSAVVRREVLSHVGAFDPQWDLAVDYDLWLRVARHHAFDYVDEPLVRYRTGHGNLSKRLLDRVDTALSIMRRHGAGVRPAAVAEAYSSTCRTLAYVVRGSEPAAAARWYLRALRWPGGRVTAAKGLVAAAVRLATGRRTPGAAENAAENR